ncbi:MAG TPA: HK97 family phage prohead protease [Vicinamibacterales bacterium]|nr:HK97 family phage prohead protease [Vicinamibacterales bacterium]
MIVGLAVPFNQVIRAPTGALWRFRFGAFDRAIATRDVDLIINHAEESSPIIATSTSGRLDSTLHLRETAAALMFRYRPEGVIGETVLRYALQGAFVGASIAFDRRTSESVFERNGTVTFIAADLRDVSLVPQGHHPRFEATWVKVMNQTETGRWQWAA